jgi:nuclear pore complex protein Nup133
VSTSSGRIFRLTLTSSGGKHHLTLHLFSRPQPSGGLSRFLPSIFSPSTTAPAQPENIAALALGARAEGGKDVWALLETRLQRWTVSDEGWEELAFDYDIEEGISIAIRNAFPNAPQEDAALDLELLDLHVQP